MSSYYAVANGRNIGVFTNWEECKKSIHQFSRPKYKKFKTIEEANDFILYHNSKSNINFDYYVYTDGACSNNGKEIARCGIGIYLGENDIRNIYLNSHKIVMASYNKGGGSSGDFTDLENKNGTFHTHLKVYTQLYDPLGNKVKKENTSDKRTTHWVPEVQL